MSFAVDFAGDLEVVAGKYYTTFAAAETSRVELLLDAAESRGARSLEVLTFDSTMAAVTERPVVFVVVLFAVWLVVDDIEICGREGLMAGPTDETSFMPSTGKSTI